MSAEVKNPLEIAGFLLPLVKEGQGCLSKSVSPDAPVKVPVDKDPGEVRQVGLDLREKIDIAAIFC
jgi:hypothetical protein